MAKKKNTKNKAIKGFGNAIPSMERWWLCQRIGKTFFHAEVSYERLLQMEEFFIVSDFLRGKDFTSKKQP
jgi:hypothetical protein